LGRWPFLSGHLSVDYAPRKHLVFTTVREPRSRILSYYLHSRRPDSQESAAGGESLHSQLFRLQSDPHSDLLLGQSARFGSTKATTRRQVIPLAEGRTPDFVSWTVDMSLLSDWLSSVTKCEVILEQLNSTKVGDVGLSELHISAAENKLFQHLVDFEVRKLRQLVESGRLRSRSEEDLDYEFSKFCEVNRVVFATGSAPRVVVSNRRGATRRTAGNTLPGVRTRSADAKDKPNNKSQLRSNRRELN